MASDRFDVIVVGGGHNGLVAAAYLARVGKSVLVCERRDRLGGILSAEQPIGGYRFDPGPQDINLFRPEIVRELGLELPLVRPDISTVSLLPDGRALRLWRDPQRTADSISEFCAPDARSYPEFARRVRRSASVLEQMLGLTPPNLPLQGGIREWRRLLPWLRVGLRLRRLGASELYGFLRWLPMDAASMLTEWFQDDRLNAALATGALQGTMQGARGAGTGLMLLYQAIGGFPRGAQFVRGGTGRLVEALASRARALGVEIRTDAAVERVLTDDYAVRGVRLSDGTELRSSCVASSADPRHTLLDLVGAPELEVRVVRRVQNLRFRGSTARVNLALRELPKFRGVDEVTELTGHLVICPGLDDLERAYDEAKYGRISAQPMLEMTIPSLHDPSVAPEGRHVLSITVRYAPYHLAEGSWDQLRESLADRALETAAQAAPDLPELVLGRQILTPLDYEREYGLTEGNLFHGQMALDQLLFMRPIPGYADYRSPVRGLYFCGAGSHPGGGVTGAPGRNAAREIARDLR